jgi:SAM-dependent methyltransferase
MNGQGTRRQRQTGRIATSQNRQNVSKKTAFGGPVGILIAAVVLLWSAVGFGAESEVDHLVQILQLKPGSIVADVGAGSGEVSIAIARRAGPQGRVYSTEINPELLDKIRNLAKSERLANIIPIAGSEHDTRLPSNCCDAIFLREVYHHLTDPFGMDRSLYRAIRPGGRLAIIDFEPNQLPGVPLPPGVPANRGGHGVPQRIVAEELTRTGFVLAKTINWPISSRIRHYCILFIKPLPSRQPLAGTRHRNRECTIDEPRNRVWSASVRLISLPSRVRAPLIGERPAHDNINDMVRQPMFIAQMAPDA